MNTEKALIAIMKVVGGIALWFPAGWFIGGAIAKATSRGEYAGALVYAVIGLALGALAIAIKLDVLKRAFGGRHAA